MRKERPALSLPYELINCLKRLSAETLALVLRSDFHAAEHQHTFFGTKPSHADYIVALGRGDDCVVRRNFTTARLA